MRARASVGDVHVVEVDHRTDPVNNLYARAVRRSKFGKVLEGQGAMQYGVDAITFARCSL